MKIDINKKYRFRNGGIARIICVDAPSEFPVIAIDDGGDPSTHTEEGRLIWGGESVHDLIEVPEPREFTIWIHPNGGTQRHEPLCTGWEGPIRTLEIID